ncbi:MAG: T9SS type A sorting domain-containing protein [Rhodothermales bacterium]
MKKTVTLFTLLLLFLSTTTAEAQVCPSADAPSLNKLGQEIFPTTGLTPQAADYVAILTSDLTRDQQLACISSKGLQDRFPTLAQADDPLASVLEEYWENDAWVLVSLLEPIYTDGVPSGNLYREWNDLTQSWENSALQTFMLDMNGNELESIFSSWNGTEYENEQRLFSSFDANGNLLSFEIQFWEDGDWVTFALSTAVIDGQTTVATTEFLDEDTGLLVLASRETITLDDQDRQLIELTEGWDADTETWVVSFRLVYEYPDATTAIELEQFSAGEDMWLDSERTVFTLNDQGQQTEAITTELFFGPPTEASRVLSTYNGMGLLTQVIDQLPDGSGGWFDDEVYTATFDADGDILEEIYQIDDGLGKNDGGATQLTSSSALQNDERYTYSYGETVTSTEEEIDHRLASFQVYPSPAQGRVQLEVNLDEPAALQIEVYDVLGRRVASLADTQTAIGPQRFTWNPAENMPAGMYFVRFQVDARVNTRTVVLMK